MQFYTERLLIRDLIPDDLQHIHHLHSLPETDEFNTLGIPDSIEDTEKLLAGWLLAQEQEPRTIYVLRISEKETGEFIGLLGFKLGPAKYRNGEVWYKILPAQWKKGYTTEAVKKLLEFGFSDLKLHRIEAGCAVDNIASIRVLEKAGMTREGGKRKALPIRGQWVDNYEYAILEEDFFS